MAYEFLKVSENGLLKVSDTGFLIAGGTPPATAIFSIKISHDGECSIKVNVLDCESREGGPIPLIRPKFEREL